MTCYTKLKCQWSANQGDIEYLLFEATIYKYLLSLLNTSFPFRIGFILMRGDQQRLLGRTPLNLPQILVILPVID